MADRILIWEEAMGQGFVDDHYWLRVRAILRRERSSGAHPHAHRPKIVGADESGADNWLFPRLKWRTPFYIKATGVCRGMRKRIRQGGRLYAGQGLDSIEQFLEISAALWRSQRVFGKAGQERERQYAIRIEALGNGH